MSASCAASARVPPPIPPPLTAGHEALKDTNAAIAWAKQQGGAIDGQAHQIASAVDALANKC
jgi:hypothetical protein